MGHRVGTMPLGTMPRTWMQAGLFLLVIMPLSVSGCRQGNAKPAAPPPVVKVAEVIQRDIPVYSEWIASTNGLMNETIHAQVQGYLVAQRYREGDLVERGKLL